MVLWSWCALSDPVGSAGSGDIALSCRRADASPLRSPFVIVLREVSLRSFACEWMLQLDKDRERAAAAHLDALQHRSVFRSVSWGKGTGCFLGFDFSEK